MDFLGDPDIKFLGYQSGANGRIPGVFLFHHRVCGTSLAVELSALVELVTKPVYAPSRCLWGKAPIFVWLARENTLCPWRCVCEFVAELSRLLGAPVKPYGADS